MLSLSSESFHPGITIFVCTSQPGLLWPRPLPKTCSSLLFKAESHATIPQRPPLSESLSKQSCAKEPGWAFTTGDLDTDLNAKPSVGVLQVRPSLSPGSWGSGCSLGGQVSVAAGGHAIYFMDDCLSTKGSAVSASLQHSLQGLPRCSQELWHIIPLFSSSSCPPALVMLSAHPQPSSCGFQVSRDLTPTAVADSRKATAVQQEYRATTASPPPPSPPSENVCVWVPHPTQRGG